MKIAVFGCGYLGAVHAACMASLGHDVLGIDVLDEQVAALSAGRAPFHEPGFPELLQSALDTGRLRFTQMQPRPLTRRSTSSASGRRNGRARTQRMSPMWTRRSPASLVC